MSNNTSFKIYNGFGINPSKNHTAAGWDFYVPRIASEEQFINALDGLKSSYGQKLADYATTLDVLIDRMCRAHKTPNDYDALNLTLLFLSYDCSELHKVDLHNNLNVALSVFDKNVVTDTDDAGHTIYGFQVYPHDHVFINTGIKVSLDPGTTGIFFNKSGRGISGWDVRACVIDEDYAGYVHLNLAYTKSYTDPKGIVWCGDKLSQMVILPLVVKTELYNCTGAEYETLMKDSTRGAKAFGSSNEVHNV